MGEVTQKEIVWTKSAKRFLTQKVPLLAQLAAREEIEKYASEKGLCVINRPIALEALKRLKER